MSTPKSTPPAAVEADDIAALSFEQALTELEAIVRELEAGQANLDDSIAHYERGTRLKEHCQNKLASARLKVEKIMQQAGGGITTEPLDATDA